MAGDRYLLHRAALAPLLPGANERSLEQSLEDSLEYSGNLAQSSGDMPFARFLCAQGLAPLWDERLEHASQAARLSPDFRNLVHQQRLQATGDYLLQRHNLDSIKHILEEAGLAHVVTKGSHTREVYYDTPALRPAVDIDILVEPANKIAAIKAFQARGFTFHGLAQNISHECSLLKGNTCIDLHWDILRPGRTREPMVEALLARRVDYGSHWGLGHGASLFLMLVHPVFTKYSTTPYASLVRLVDLAQLLHRHPDSVDDALPLLHTAGLSTAGWITMTWLDLLTDSPRVRALAEKIAPGRLRRKYLHTWLANNLSTRLLGSPGLIQLGFTLPAHDTFGDALRATRQARRHGQQADTTLAAIQKQVLSTP